MALAVTVITIIMPIGMFIGMFIAGRWRWVSPPVPRPQRTVADTLPIRLAIDRYKSLKVNGETLRIVSSISRARVAGGAARCGQAGLSQAGN